MKDYVLKQIKQIAVKYNIEKIMLFGSRARGDNSNLSDYDIAVFSDNFTSTNKALFSSEIEEIETLKKIDLVFVNDKLDEQLIKNITKEGILIHEQVRDEIDKL